MPVPTVAELSAAIRSGDRSALAKAITLVESTRADHREQAQELLLELMPQAGSAMHVGITGVPGVGKSAAKRRSSSPRGWTSARAVSSSRTATRCPAAPR